MLITLTLRGGGAGRGGERWPIWEAWFQTLVNHKNRDSALLFPTHTRSRKTVWSSLTNGKSLHYWNNWSGNGAETCRGSTTDLLSLFRPPGDHLDRFDWSQFQVNVVQEGNWLFCFLLRLLLFKVYFLLHERMASPFFHLQWVFTLAGNEISISVEFFSVFF